MRPPGPVPCSVVRSMPSALAILRASGDTLRRPLASAESLAVTTGAGTDDSCFADTTAASGVAAGASAPSVSPDAVTIAIGVLTGTVMPGSIKIFANTPSIGAAKSTVAFSVSISPIVSPRATASPIFFIQRATLPSVISKPIEGIVTFVDILDF